jgi:hypothetical protein
MVFGMVGLLTGLVVVMFLKLAYPDFFDMSSFGMLILMGLLIVLGVVGMWIAEHVTLH